MLAAVKLTQHTQIPPGLIDGDMPDLAGILKFLLKAEHTSVLEHIFWTVYIENVSRSFLAQITRHRVGSFTSASQHYSDYREMPFILDESLVDDSYMKGSLRHALESYKAMVDAGTPKEEARQGLPNAAAVNLIWTVNARSLYNFLEQRHCKRNVKEMRIFATKLLKTLSPTWPAFFNMCGAYCLSRGKCNQGRMTCGEPYDRELD